MSRKNTQHKLSSYKPPRVHITYDLEVNGGKKEQEIPFLIGVLANFSGHKHTKVKKLKNEKFLPVDKENFNNVVQAVSPKLNIKVANKLGGETPSRMFELNFSSIEDFNPGKIASKVEPLKKLLEVRRKLAELQTNVDCNEKLEELLIQLLKMPEALKKISSGQNEDSSGSLN